MKGGDKSYETENVVTAQSPEMNSPFFRRYDFDYPTSHSPALDALHVLLEILELLDGRVEYGNSTRREWVIKTQPCSAADEFGVRGYACPSPSTKALLK